MLKRSAKQIEDEIERAMSRINSSEKEIEDLQAALKDGRTKNKKIEFETQTLQDELAFCKAVFDEELADMVKFLIILKSKFKITQNAWNSNYDT